MLSLLRAGLLTRGSSLRPLSTTLIKKALSSSFGQLAASRSSQQSEKDQPFLQTGESSPQTSESSPQAIEKPSLTSAQHAFLARFGVKDILSHELCLACLYPPTSWAGNASFRTLVFLGAHHVEFFVTEYLAVRYPKLPSGDLKHAVSLYTDAALLDKIVTAFGLHLVIQGGQGDNMAEQARQSLLALLGALSLQTPIETRSFIQRHILSFPIEKSKLLPTRRYKGWLTNLTRRLGKARPIYRLEGETGRQSNSSMFLIGVYSGLEKLGEGKCH